METATMATAAGVAMLLYFVLSRRLSARDVEDVSKPGKAGRRRVALRRPAQAPATWREAASTLVETLRFAYTETLGKWPIGDLAFGIKYLIRRQAANYLNIKSLLDLTCQTLADMIKAKTPEEIRKFFNIKNKFTREEEEEIRRENQWGFE